MTCQHHCENIAAEWRDFYIAICVHFTCHSGRQLESPRRQDRQKWTLLASFGMIQWKHWISVWVTTSW